MNESGIGQVAQTVANTLAPGLTSILGLNHRFDDFRRDFPDDGISEGGDELGTNWAR